MGKDSSRDIRSGGRSLDLFHVVMHSPLRQKNLVLRNIFLLSQEDDAKSSGTSSPDSIGSVETSISSHFGGMNYPSLFSSKPAYGSSQSTVCS